MTTSTTTISQKGQIVLPKFIRDELGIKPADSFNVSLENNRIIVEKALDITDFYGAFSAKKVLTKSEIKNIYQKAVLAKHLK
jgi:AbrB family looped-hinge helix DNA binding protein